MFLCRTWNTPGAGIADYFFLATNSGKSWRLPGALCVGAKHRTVCTGAHVLVSGLQGLGFFSRTLCTASTLITAKQRARVAIGVRRDASHLHPQSASVTNRANP